MVITIMGNGSRFEYRSHAVKRRRCPIGCDGYDYQTHIEDDVLDKMNNKFILLSFFAINVHGKKPVYRVSKTVSKYSQNKPIFFNMKNAFIFAAGL